MITNADRDRLRYIRALATIIHAAELQADDSVDKHEADDIRSALKVVREFNV